jgi:hypothetical protein
MLGRRSSLHDRAVCALKPAAATRAPAGTTRSTPDDCPAAAAVEPMFAKLGDRAAARTLTEQKTS